MIRTRRTGTLLLLIGLIATAGVAAAQKPDPLMGDWQGQWAKGRPRSIAAQVISRGQRRYQVNIVPELDQRAAPLAVLNVQAEGDAIRFEQEGWSGVIEGEKFTGTGSNKGKPVAFEMKKTVRPSTNLGIEPPEGAIVLFDGGGFDHWQAFARNGVSDDVPWKIIDDTMQVGPTFEEHAFGVSIGTRQAFGDFRMHLEFRLPLLAEVTGQNRANSGVIFEDYHFYELQILDSYGLHGYYDECGAIYKIAAPKVNMCAPPLQWQSYDVTYHGPKFDDQGNLKAPARITVDHNGKPIHKDQEFPFSEAAAKARRERPDSRMPGRIKLQNHGDPIEFRNVWIVDLSKTGK
jgi:hypothetical protein